MSSKTETVLTYSRHPASKQWPDLNEDEYVALLDSIRDHGQDHPILVVNENVVIDGWQRLRACDELGAKPKIEKVNLDDREIAERVITLHSGRRHLTKQQIIECSIKTKRACGIKFADPNRPAKGKPKADADEPDPFAEDEITAEAEAKEAGSSKQTANRAIQNVKREEGILPPKPKAPAKSKKADDDLPDPFADDEPEKPKAPAQAKKPADKPKADPVPDLPDDPTDDLRKKIDVLQEQIDLKDEQIANIQSAAAAKGGKDAIDKLNNLTAENRTLKSQVNEWQSKHAEAQRTIKNQKGRISRLEKQVANLTKTETPKTEGAKK